MFNERPPLDPRELENRLWSRTETKRCPLCKTTPPQWDIALVGVERFAPDGLPVIGVDPTTRLASVTCTHCGNTLLIRPEMLGL
jgi:hypothetical protein